MAGWPYNGTGRHRRDFMEGTRQPKEGSAERRADERGNVSRKRSTFVKLGITAAAVVALRWCLVPPPGDNRDAQRCVGDDGRVVEDRYCEQGPATAPHAFHWYYGGNGYYPGDRVSGGSDKPIPGAAPVRTSSAEFSSGAGGESVTRGGFGATAEGIGSGE